MNTLLRKAILDFLTPLPCMRTEDARQAALYAAGLDGLLNQADLSGGANKAVPLLVNALEEYGTVDGEPALTLALRYVATTVGSDKRLLIQDFCERLRQDSQDKNAYDFQQLTVYVASRPTEPDSPPMSGDLGPNPYKGLSAFQETDADRFFGREHVTEALWEQFCARYERPPGGPPPLRLLAILGPSGSGKSSVARAGLLPKLAAQPLPGTQRTRVAIFTPGTRPLETLAVMLARMITDDPAPLRKSRELLEELWQADPTPTLPEREGASPLFRRGAGGEVAGGLHRIADLLPMIDAQPLVLLIDQFEEVYSPDVNADERRQFLDNLLCAAADPSGHVAVILTLRSDFLGRTQSHPEFNKAMARQGEIVEVMNETELRRAIAAPAEQAGHALDDACVDLLIEQSRDREGALPLLQFALTAIWDGLAEGVSPADTLKRIGGVGGALAGEAQRLYEKLSDADKAIARRAFLALVQLGEGARDTRRRISLTDVVAHGEEAAHVQAVVRFFADPRARLVTLSAAPDGTETAEVTHEALLDHWITLKEWLDDNREDLRFHRHLAADAAYWEAQARPDGKLWQAPDLDLLRQYYQRAGHDMTPVQVEFFEASKRKERHSKRVRRLVVAALTVLTVLMSVATSVAWWAYNQANEQKIEAEKQKDEAQHQALVSLVHVVTAYASQHVAAGEREQAALLARQAYFLNQDYDAGADDRITAALRLALVLPDEEPQTLLELVCDKVTHNLSLKEWQQIVNRDDIPYINCLNLTGSDKMLRLRSEPMVTDEEQHLSLNVRASRFVATDIDNDFENLGMVVIDHATGLMWQQSGSDEDLTYAEAQDYIKTLNSANFGGYHDWRLPTVEELLSLVEKERNSDDLRISPIFDAAQYWCWSADLWKIKDGNLSESTWYVSFSNGGVYWSDFINVSSYVRAVRS